MSKLVHTRNFEQYNCFDFKNETDFLTIPDALIERNRDMLFSSWMIFENQLSQVDPLNEPEVYMALDDRANTLFSAWLQFRHVGVEA